MSEESTEAPAMAPEITEARDALVQAEVAQGNAGWAEEFKTQTFASKEEMFKAYAERSDTPTGTDESTPDDGGGSDEPDVKLAGKFESVGDLEKGYLELQKKLGAPKEESPVVPDEAPKEPQGDLDSPQGELEIKAQEAAEQAGLDINELQQSYQKNGSLSEDQFAALAKAGLDKSQVESFISEVAEARAFKAEQASQKVFESVGGKDSYEGMVKWAQGNLSESEITAYNTAVNSGDMGLVNLAVQGLQAKYTKVNGQGSTKGFISGASKANQGVTGYEHLDQMVADMNKSEYQTSPSFRAKVEARVAKTTAF